MADFTAISANVKSADNIRQLATGYYYNAFVNARSWVITAYDPLRGSLTASSNTTLEIDIYETPSTLDPTLIQVAVDGVLVYDAGSFLGEFTTSTITPVGGGVYTLLLIKDTDWSVGAREVKIYLPDELI